MLGVMCPAGFQLEVTAKVEFFVTPLDIGSGVASPALVTYKRQEGASETQACIHHPQGVSIVQDMLLCTAPKCASIPNSCSTALLPY